MPFPGHPAQCEHKISAKKHHLRASGTTPRYKCSVERDLHKYMINNVMVAMKALENITDLAKKTTIIDAILNTKVA